MTDLPRSHFVTSSGMAVHLEVTGERPDFDSLRIRVRVQTAAGATEKIMITLDCLPILSVALKQEGFELDQVRNRIAVLATLDVIDHTDDFPVDANGNRPRTVDGELALALLRRPRSSDREVRRYIARRLFDHASRNTLNEHLSFDDFDLATMGASKNDFIRNAQILEQEGYLQHRPTGPEAFLDLMPRATLIRAVERYGAPPEDAATITDYLAVVDAYPLLSAHKALIAAEFRRYATSQSNTELTSVFRAIAPVVEAVLRDLLTQHGSTRDVSTLGPAIGEARRLSIGGPARWAELGHVLKFVRDQELHGSTVSPTVLRIACENAFELLPKLAALFPPSGDP